MSLAKLYPQCTATASVRANKGRVRLCCIHDLGHAGAHVAHNGLAWRRRWHSVLAFIVLVVASSMLALLVAVLVAGPHSHPKPDRQSGEGRAEGAVYLV